MICRLRPIGRQFDAEPNEYDLIFPILVIDTPRFRAPFIVVGGGGVAGTKKSPQGQERSLTLTL